MNKYKKFLEDEEEVLFYKDKLKQHIKEEYPEASPFNFEDLICWFLMNMHETLSTVSSNLCSLSKSTYDAQVYIDEIREHQEKENDSIIHDDIMDIINNEEMNDKEKVEEIKSYVLDLNIF